MVYSYVVDIFVLSNILSGSSDSTGEGWSEVLQT